MLPRTMSLINGLLVSQLLLSFAAVLYVADECADFRAKMATFQDDNAKRKAEDARVNPINPRP